jgi:hypothetical protein
VTPSAPALVSAYADRFDSRFSDGSHRVGSPLGVWLLLALVAPVAQGADREELEAALGAGADDAAEIARRLVDDPHPAVAAAIALWHRPEQVLRAFDDWSRGLPATTETGPIPSQAQADEWARRVTLGLIGAFPGEIDSPHLPTAFVLANALATRVEWTEPFELTGSDRFRGPWRGVVQRVLEAPPRGHRMVIADTERAGRVAAHAARSHDGLLVVSVIADPHIEQHDVQAAAHDVGLVLAREASMRALVGPTTAEKRSLFDLPLGDGHAWTLTEHMAADQGGPAERYDAVLPAWDASGTYDLVAAGPGLGCGAVGSALERLGNPEFAPFRTAVKQAAVARYDRRGFEAAAVTTLVFTGSARTRRTRRERVAELRFDRPYAVVAIATADGARDMTAWHGVPVFSAWVAEPSEPEPGAEPEPTQRIVPSD